MMPKSDTIEAIVRLNPTANPAFLAEFGTGDLAEYLRRLESVSSCIAPRPQAQFDWAGAKLPATPIA